MRVALIIVALVYSSVGDEASERIYNGRKAHVAEFPYMVSLQKAVAANRVPRKYCGGAIIDKYWILTAAHCLDKVTDINLLHVKAGVTKSYDIDQDVRVVKAVKHPGYNHSDLYVKHDIALLKLKKPLNYTNNVRIIALPEPGFNVTEKLGIVTGFGTIGPRTENYDLLKGTLRVLPNKDCRKFLPNISQEQICLGGTGSTSCVGDGGGPFIVQDNNRKSVIAGIFSLGGGECQSRNKVIFTNVEKFVDWIENTIKEN